MARRAGTVSSFLAVIVAGCAQQGTATPPTPMRIGVYRFTERPSQLKQTIQGRLLVTHDSVVVEAEPGPCRYDTQSSAAGPIVYQCADITLSFDRRDPVGRATYRAVTTVIEHHTVCAKYATDSAGRQVCVQQQTETNERQVPVMGTLHLETIAHPN